MHTSDRDGRGRQSRVSKIGPQTTKSVLASGLLLNMKYSCLAIRVVLSLHLFGLIVLGQEQQFANLGDFQLENGALFRICVCSRNPWLISPHEVNFAEVVRSVELCDRGATSGI
jgi:hypothetical protein